MSRDTTFSHNPFLPWYEQPWSREFGTTISGLPGVQKCSLVYDVPAPDEFGKLHVEVTGGDLKEVSAAIDENMPRGLAPYIDAVLDWTPSVKPDRT